jgi:hypothetical protein
LAALGGTEALPKVPVREGASEAIIRLDLGDYVVTRKIKAKDGGEYTTSLTIETPDGVKAKSPQTLLNDLVGRFSSKNSFHLLSSDARALGTYLVSTGLNVPVGELAQAMGQQKQIVSKLVHRGEDLRDNAVADRIIRRVEEIYGVGA